MDAFLMKAGNSESLSFAVAVAAVAAVATAAGMGVSTISSYCFIAIAGFITKLEHAR